MATKEQIKSAIAQGRAAKKASRPLAACPYDILEEGAEKVRAYAWLRGYRKG